MKYIILCIILFFYSPVFAGEIPLKNAEQEAQARELFASLRCMVCEGEPLSESQADLAETMRIAIREQIAAGEKPEDIMAGYVSQYGEKILMKPRLSAATGLLWFAPFLLLVFGGAVLYHLSAKKR